ncbi:bifunctional glycosyltransferase family 2/GtrA family protein [uncultured Desulfosarcina sp.]|uniref:bifunctional glycosyltransferase family 2/GtrA family protein n=1 Tax=uncultured Desulfosarcina sp. TaxID=218289 RepID=UPI0029C97B0F|nr:bifunctional glycosyltransferase family 2/GtrA family protein [uncultured Desulfosarcina sp.]
MIQTCVKIDQGTPAKLSVIIPCYNEEATLRRCIKRVLEIQDALLSLEIIIVDDASRDNSLSIARDLAEPHKEIVVERHRVNRGKGAALRTGFKKATGDFVAVQDADLEYDPMELKTLLTPLLDNRADVVIGSRFLASGAHRVLYFWHSVGNRFLTLMSNMFTDLNLTDMESCYKVFRREIIQSIDLKENRFGFEPEVVAKVAQMRFRIYEIGISYSGRTYEEGKKIGARDGFRALYCILKYNAHKAPLPMQFLIYLFIGGVAAISNLFLFLSLYKTGIQASISAPIAFMVAAVVNYALCVLILFKHQVRWKAPLEMLAYTGVVGAVACVDLMVVKYLLHIGSPPVIAKLAATGMALILNFLGRRFIVFPEKPSGPWQPQNR